MWLVYRLSKGELFCIFSKYTAFAAVGSQALLLSFGMVDQSFFTKANRIKDRSCSLGKFSKSPNIYLFVIDAFPHRSTVKALFGFNDILSSELSKIGFFVPKESFSNYGSTRLSISSEMKCDYLKTKKDLKIPYSEASSSICYISNKVVQTIKDNGYRYIFASGQMFPLPFVRKIKVAGGIDDLILAPRRKDIISRICSNDVLATLATQSVAHVFMPKKNLSKVIDNSIYIEPGMIKRALPDILSAKKKFFLFAHFFQIHDNVVTNADGTKKSSGFIYVGGKESNTAFVKTIQVFSRKFLDLINFIVENDKNALIVINSDHGLPVILNGEYSAATGRLAKSMTNSQFMNHWMSDFAFGGIVKQVIQYRYRNLIAMRFPEKTKLDSCFAKFSDGDRFSNVNIFRCVFDFLGIKNIEKLKSKSFPVSSKSLSPEDISNMYKSLAKIKDSMKITKSSPKENAKEKGNSDSNVTGSNQSSKNIEDGNYTSDDLDLTSVIYADD
ncbi:hypothetical protein HYD_5020 [Candidatus Hydrogenosomobacter endosymbioticus]|uniref:Sulfatase N-terminal domain-containing protein n=2 Tax=Candidatus Hydrogenosomobacter endosymbioticus TaxID=2558174 RepID=A0ABM7V9A4_9PROT|nr:hypothetical protein HYD_5020 [Candidatus Hydrogenosomobacter endosymbioticus]